ncbi:hypothetical protein EFK07_18595 [Pseudomonas putida]|uniref:Uncharacterized protein n=1 Tax=Pseudomonas putida TaxID=303 RepID=A0A3M8T067_PSEPU|nr:hypothetical protein EFK07_18595 [Pseudomonas putida]
MQFCGSGLVSRKGCKSAPAICAVQLKSRGCCAALSRHKAAPTQNVSQGKNLRPHPPARSRCPRWRSPAAPPPARSPRHRAPWHAAR